MHRYEETGIILVSEVASHDSFSTYQREFINDHNQ